MKPVYLPNYTVSIPKSVYSPHSVSYVKRKTKLVTSDGSKLFKYGCSTLPGNRNYLVLDKEPETKKVLDYISVPPGVGKTKWAIDYIAANSRSRKEIIVYCAPTTLLLKQVFLDTKRVFKLTENTKLSITFRGVQEDKELSQYTGFRDMSELRPMTYYASTIMERMTPGSCLFLTHATFLSIKDYLRKGRYHVIFDEAAEMQISPDKMQIDQKSVALLNSMVAFQIFPNIGIEPAEVLTQSIIDREYQPYYRLRCLEDSSSYSDRYKNFADITKNHKLVELIQKASQDQFSVFVKEERVKNKHTYHFFDFVTPNGIFHGYDKVTLLSAFFEESLMFKILQNSYELRNVNHLVDTEREKAIYQGYRNLEIIYLFDFNRPLSKNFLENAVHVKEGREDYYLKFLDRYVPLISNELMLEDKEATKVLVEHIVKEPNSRVLTIMEKRLKEKDFDRFDYIAEKLKPAHKAIQSLIRKDLKKRVTEGFEVVEKPLVIANLGKVIQNRFGKTQHVDLMVPIHKGFEWLRTRSHGLNSFSKRNVFVSLAALNMQPHVMAFYDFLLPNFDTSILSTHTILQGVTRTRIRKIDNTKKVLLYVFSKKEAEALHRAFQGNPTLTSLDAYLHSYYLGKKRYKEKDEVIKEKKEVALKRKKESKKKTSNDYLKDAIYKATLYDYNSLRYQYKKLSPEDKEAIKIRKNMDKLNLELKERRSYLRQNKVA